MHSVILASLVVVLIGLILFPSQAFSAEVKPKVDFEKIKILKEKFTELKTKVDKINSIPVIIGLDTDFVSEGKLTSSDVKIQKNKIGQDQDSLLSFLKNYRAEKIKKFEHLPFLAMTVDKATLQRLEASPRIAMIAEDTLFKPLLAQSVPLIGAPDAWARGFSGQGQAIGILDTGVDKTHSAFAVNRVVSEACYSHHDPPNSFFTLCPNGATVDTNPGSAVPCQLTIPGCDHGTHVAGIAAGNDVTYSGVAKDANIIAIQVFTKFTDSIACGGPAPCILAYNSDIVGGLDRIMTLSNTIDISSVNLSLGGGSYTTVSACDGDSDNVPIKMSVDNLRSIGIATVAASGNDGSSNSLNAPACLSSVVSVGSTTKTDAISSFSNSASFLDLLAPGSGITSSVPGNTFGVKSGTSMATPHVAGAWAVLKSGKPTATVTEVLNVLKNTGTPILDTRNGFTFPRIQVDSAMNDLVPPIGVPWYDNNWQFRKAITIDRTKVAATLTDFTVLISRTDANLLASAQGDGDDILFTSADGTTKLSHEIESWNDAPGKLTAWVKIPNLSSITNTKIYMYYGNAASANQEDVSGTWNSNYKMVQHLEEDPTQPNPAIIDSTANRNDLDAIGMESVDLVQAKIGQGLSFDTTISEYLKRNPFNGISGTTSTWSFWMRSSDVTTSGTPLSYAVPSGSDNEWLLFNYNNFKIYLKGTHLGITGKSTTNGIWHDVVVTRSGTQVKLFIDGTNVFSSSSGSASPFTTGGCLIVGQEQDTICGGFDSLQNFEGEIDEIRISGITHSNNWIITEYNNQNNPGTFYTVGTEETSSVITSPGQITDLAGTVGDSKVVLTWSAPSDGGSPITDYIIEYKESASPTYMVFVDGVSSSTGTTVTGLTNGISYDFRVKAENGIGQGPYSSIVTMTPIASCPIDWIDCNWQFRKAITIDRTKVAATLTDFTVLISRTDANLLASAQGDGDDILFTSADGTTKLSHEIESWNDAPGKLTAWVKIPNLSSITNTKIYMYYGNAASANQEDVSGTWNSNYKMVQHLEEDPTQPNPAIIDSTANRNDLDAIGMESVDLVQAKIGQGLSFDTTISEYLKRNPFNGISGTTSTWSFWMRSSDVTTSGTPLSYAVPSGSDNEWLLFNYNNFKIYLKGTHLGITGKSTTNGIWHDVVVTRSGTQVKLFIDGTNVFSSSSGSASPFTTGGCLIVGQEQDTICGGFDSLQNFEGEIDEIRISGITHSNNWIITEYNNQNNPGTFYTVGTEEVF